LSSDTQGLETKCADSAPSTPELRLPIPHSTFIRMLTYKAQLLAIKVVVQEKGTLQIAPFWI